MSPVPDPSPPSSPEAHDDLFVQAVSVQGGEADIAGEKMAFARVALTGVGFERPRPNTPVPRRQEFAVLKLAEADELAARLAEVLDLMSRSTPTPVAPAMGLWAWRSEPPLDNDVLVVGMTASVVAIRDLGRVSPTVRVELIGMEVQDLTSAAPPAHVKRAVFSGPRQAQTLISSLRKVTRSAREKQRVDVYVPQDRPFTRLQLIS